MSASDDPKAAMRRDDFDRELADRLLGGQLDPDDAPAGLGELIALVRAAGGPPTSNELGAERAVVEAMAATPDAIGVPPVGRKPVLVRAIHTRAAVLAVLAAVGVGAVAAAVTVDRSGDQIGNAGPGTDPIVVTVPSSIPEESTPTTSSTSSTTSTTTSTTTTAAPTTVAVAAPSPANAGVGPDASGPAAFGLCVAWTAHQRNGAEPNGVAFHNLDIAAAEVGQTTADYCAAVLAAKHGPDAGDTDDDTVATASASNGTPPARNTPPSGSGDPGPPPDVPGATAPGRGGP